MANFDAKSDLFAKFMDEYLANKAAKQNKSTDMWSAMVRNMAGEAAVPSRMGADSVRGVDHTERERNLATAVIELNSELEQLATENQALVGDLREANNMIETLTEYKKQLMGDRNRLQWQVEQLESQLTAYRDPGKRVRIVRLRK